MPTIDRLHYLPMIETRFHTSISELPATTWDSLRATINPFVAHAWLNALEQTQCIRADWGWRPYHLGLYERGKLVAAAPLYLKGNSHGEFVFDWSWADAWEHAGGQYYPKLLNATPYTPVTGPRLLAGRHSATPILQRALVEAMRDEAERLKLSSVHANFLDEREVAAFDEDWLARIDVQFHWSNPGYIDFAEFLDALNHKKRKNILRERSRVQARGLVVEMRRADSLHLDEWRRIHALYQSTFDTKGNHAALTAAFFTRVAERMGEAVQVALARRDHDIVAMAYFVQGDDTLYGRYWGANTPTTDGQFEEATEVEASLENKSDLLQFLHFELCYYQGIEFCITHGLRRFEPGAQGANHKMPRGFMPTVTHSRHYLSNPQFRNAVKDALCEEPQRLLNYIGELEAHSPFKRT